MNKETENLNNQLIKAVKNYRSKKVSRLIKKGADPDTVINEDGKTLVMEAASNCYPKTLKALIDSGADIHLKTKEEELNAFLYACSSGCIETITILAEAGAKVTETDISKKNGLMYTVKYKEIETVNYLTEKGIDINARDTDGESMLYFALEGLSSGLEDETDKEYIKQLINLGADVNQENNDGNSFFTFAVRSEYIDFVKFLLENGGDVISHGNGLFSEALGNDSRDITELLWEYADKSYPLIIRYKTEWECEQCNRTVSLPEPKKQIECPHCSTIVKIEEDEWAGIFEDSVFLKLKTYGGELEFERMRPVCLNCNESIDISKLDNSTDNVLICSSCAYKHQINDPEDWLKEYEVYGLKPFKIIKGQDNHKSSDKTEETLELNCISCSAPMKLTQTSERNYTCEHCGTNQFLTDPVWLKLHPVAVNQYWYIYFA